MKVLTLVFSMLIAVSANALCSSRGIWCWPQSNSLKANGVLIVHFYGLSQAIPSGLNKNYPIYLMAGKEKVRLNVEEILVGGYNITQVVLRPETELRAGLTYELRIDNLNDSERSLKKWNQTTKKYENLRWTVQSEKDIESPRWQSFPTYESKSYQLFGCGPAKYVNYKLAANDASEVMVKTVVKNKLTGKTTSYYLIIEDGQIQIGHGMCSGGFDFDDGKAYEVNFSLMDASGNKTEAITGFSFTSPKSDILESREIKKKG